MQLSEEAKKYFRVVVRYILTENVDDALQRAANTVEQGLQDNCFDLTPCWQDIMHDLKTIFFLSKHRAADTARLKAATQERTWVQTELYKRWWFRIWCLNALIAAGYV